jgi:hypothetical protein
MSFGEKDARDRHDPLTDSEAKLWVDAANASMTRRVSEGESEEAATQAAAKDADDALSASRESQSEQLTCFESFAGQTIEADNRLLSKLKFVGAESRNGYRYSEQALREAVSLYDNQPVFLDHSRNLSKPFERSARDLAGYTRAPYLENGSIFGAVETIDTEAGRTLLALAKANGTKAGMSHVVKARRNPSKGIVERIEEVISVDAVIFPATTSTFTESSRGGQDDSRKDRDPGFLTDPQQQKEPDMDLSKLTLEQLRESRKDLVEKVLAESQSAAEVSKLKADLDAAVKLVESYKDKEAQQQRLETIKAELTEAKLDLKNKTVCSNVFLESLLACEDETRRKALIADRAAIFSHVHPSGLPQQPKYKSGGNSVGGNLSEALAKNPTDILRELRS